VRAAGVPYNVASRSRLLLLLLLPSFSSRARSFLRHQRCCCSELFFCPASTRTASALTQPHEFDPCLLYCFLPGGIPTARPAEVERKTPTTGAGAGAGLLRESAKSLWFVPSFIIHSFIHLSPYRLLPCTQRHPTPPISFFFCSPVVCWVGGWSWYVLRTTTSRRPPLATESYSVDPPQYGAAPSLTLHCQPPTFNSPTAHSHAAAAEAALSSGTSRVACDSIPPSVRRFRWGFSFSTIRPSAHRTNNPDDGTTGKAPSPVLLVGRDPFLSAQLRPEPRAGKNDKDDAAAEVGGGGDECGSECWRGLRIAFWRRIDAAVGAARTLDLDGSCCRAHHRLLLRCQHWQRLRFGFVSRRAAVSLLWIVG